MTNTMTSKIAELKALNEKNELLNKKKQTLQDRVDDMIKNKKIEEIKTKTDSLIECLRPWMSALEVLSMPIIELDVFEKYDMVVLLGRESITLKRYFSVVNDRWLTVDISNDSKDWVKFWLNYGHKPLLDVSVDAIEKSLEKELLPLFDKYIDSAKKDMAEQEQRIGELECYIAS